MRTLLFSISILISSLVWAHGTYTGYSGAPGTRGTCASSCHGSSGGSITITGFPATYTPGQVYLLTVKHASGSVIRNFNASVRVGTGSTIAGTLAAALNTSIYNATGETSGVHFTSVTHDSGQFNWTAPAAGTGAVRIYLGGLQGSSANGTNSTFTAVSNEAAGSAPTAASNPSPVNSATGVIPGTITLHWSRGTGATSQEFFFGTTTPPPSLGTRTDTSNAVQVVHSTTYYWRVNETNGTGTTTGPIWSFTTYTPPLPTNPLPITGDSTIQSTPVQLSWQLTGSQTPVSIWINSGRTNPPPFVTSISGTSTSFSDTLRDGDGVYYWQVNQVFGWGTVNGPVWSFTKTTVNGVTDISRALPISTNIASAYPNPFNPTTTIRYSIAHPSNVTLQVFDLTGKVVATLANGRQSTGSYEVMWDASKLNSGIYFYRLTADNQSFTGRMLLIK